MKKYIGLVFLIAVSFKVKAQHTLEKIWETDSVVAIPESVLPDYKKGFMFVSQIDGAGWAADGKGEIGKISFDGKIIDLNWVTGLNAPKGLGRFGNKLYVADISEVVVMDIAEGKIVNKIAIEQASGLNDITVDDKGAVYVSDSRTSKIHKIVEGKASVYLEDIKGVNGLKAIGKDLYIAGGKNLLKADEKKNLTKIAELPQAGDGLEPVGNGDFIFSSWGGYIYYVYADGRHDLLLDVHLEKKNTADIAYDQTKKILYVPTFNKKSVMAFYLR